MNFICECAKYYLPLQKFFEDMGTYIFLAVSLVVIIAIYSVVVLKSMTGNPLRWTEHYPKNIQAAYYKHEHYEPMHASRASFLKKVVVVGFAIVVLSIILSLAGIQSGKMAVVISYAMWLVLVWWDCLIIKFIFFGRLKDLRLPGTEDMDSEYKGKWFHFARAVKYSVLGAFIALATGVFVRYLTII